MNCYLESLPEESMTLVKWKPSYMVFKFGVDEIKKSLEVIDFPWIIAGTRICISTDVVDSNIPLPLTKHSMKRLKAKLDFENDVAQIFGVPQNLTYSFFSHFFNSNI